MRFLVSILLFYFFCLSANAQELSIFQTGFDTENISIEREPYINTDRSEFSPAFYGEHIAYVYAPAKGTGLDPTIDQPFFNIGYAEVGEDGYLTELIPFMPIFNSDLHEGPLAYSEANGKLYFTRVNILSLPTSDFKKARRQIVVFDFDTQATSLMTFNDNAVDVCHPTVNESGDMMIIATNYHGRADMDLCFSTKIDTAWTTPIPLQLTVNTENNEFFPFLYNDSILIFASDRPGGIGGYDLYASIYEQGIWKEAKILPTPFNSPYDDLGLIIDLDGQSGYFSSNRSGNDDIYKWSSDDNLWEVVPDIISAKRNQQVIKLFVRDKLTFQPIHDATVSLLEIDIGEEISKMVNSDDNALIISDGEAGQLLFKISLKGREPDKILRTGADGIIDMPYESEKNYVIITSHEEHEDFQILLLKKDEKKNIDILLDPKDIKPTSKPAPKRKPIYIPTKKGETVVFDNIYYDYNSSKIKDGAAEELDALAESMKSNPNMVVKLSAHTDSRGPESYNRQLSEKRATSAKKYLENKGIKGSRIVTVGHGESKLRNHCVDNIECTEEQHQYNRRTEVEILDN